MVGLASLYDQMNVVRSSSLSIGVQNISFTQSAEFARRGHWSLYSILSALKMHPKWVNLLLVIRKVSVLFLFPSFPSDEIVRFTAYDAEQHTFRARADWYGCWGFGNRNLGQHTGWHIYHFLMVNIDTTIAVNKFCILQYIIHLANETNIQIMYWQISWHALTSTLGQ